MTTTAKSVAVVVNCHKAVLETIFITISFFLSKFTETQEYLRKPNVLYPPWTSSPPTEHYHTLPTNLHHIHQHHPPHHHHSHHHHHISPRLYHGPESSMFGPGSYHTIAHYQLYKRPVQVDYCQQPEYYHHRSHFMSLEPPVADFAKTLGQ